MTSVVQRRVAYDVLDWDATKVGPPMPRNGADPRFIEIPPTGQIAVSALVDVKGDAGDTCATHQLGTAQTAWVAWTVMRYRGRTSAEGSVTVRHNARMPMRDPGVCGGVWYDPAIVQSPTACGGSVSLFHRDSPWHSPPKARNNSRVAGSPLNFLVGYSRGLHLVTYLTARDGSGHFLRRPLKFVYWNSLQSFRFTPQPPTPGSAAGFLGMWPHTGQVTVNIGARGSGAVGDAPYFDTPGACYNDHFNDAGNWTVQERGTW